MTISPMLPARLIPISDIDVIATELALADMDTVDKALARAQKMSKSGDKDALKEAAVLERVSQSPRSGTAGTFS